ncbi:MAG TPA: hypothetical protein EYO33_32675 [Phycisphaerales bacterium]|nr:hypothetical protein [Phycisphaerales bacterium]
MITEIRQDVVDLWEGMRGPNGTLEGIKHHQAGDENVLSDYFPAVTFEWDQFSQLKYVGNRWEFRLRFAATLYTASLKTLREGAIDHINLVCRYESGKLRGLIPACAYLAQGYETTSGQHFLISPLADSQSFAGKSKKHRHWSFKTVMLLEFQTWLNTSQVI